jgi:gas vesicle protein
MSEKNSDLLKGLFIGGLIGVVLGILYAPKSGKETREDIARKLKIFYPRAKKNMKKRLKKAKRLMKQPLNI